MGAFKSSIQVGKGCFDSEEKEIEWVFKESQKWTQVGDPVAILLPKHKLIKKIIKKICKLQEIDAPDFPKDNGKINYEPTNRHFEENNLPFRYLGNDYGSLNHGDIHPLIYLMTYHSAKGLDFETVFLPYLNDNLKIWEDDEDCARRLFYVASTRSRRNLFLTHSGIPHTYVSRMPQEHLKDINTSGEGFEEEDDYEDF